MKKKFLLSSVALLTGLSFTVNPNFVQAQSSVHTVQAGEYLYSIAQAYGVSVEDLRAWNGLSSDMVLVGDQLIVDGTSGAATSDSSATTNTSGTYVVQPGDVLVNIAARYGVTVENLVAWNGLSSDWLTVGDTLVVYGDASASSSLPTSTWTPTTSTSTGYYTVQAGDTLSGIAAAFGVTTSDLYAWNGLSSDWLWVGDVLAVGGYSSGAYTTTNTTSTASSQTYATGTYTVQAGDTLQDIALAYGITVEDLMAINGLSSTWLMVGDTLAVPVTSSTTTTDTTAPSVEETTTSTDSQTTESADNSDDPLAITDSERESGVKAKHEVQEGDNLYRIANRYGVTVYNLKLWNNIGDDNTITVGDILLIKGSVYEARKHKVTTEDTLETLAETYATTVDFLTEWNDLTDGTLTPDQEIFVSDPEPSLHQVQTGETLEEIASMYQVSVEDIRLWNELPANTSLVNGTLVVSNPAGQAEKIDPASVGQETTTSTETTDTTTTAE